MFLQEGVIIYDNFFYRAKRTVYKWWCVIYKPVYKLTHHGYWPQEKEPYYIPPEEKTATALAETKADVSSDTDISGAASGNAMVSDNATASSGADSGSAAVSPDTVSGDSTISDDVARKANEIIERLAREAAEDEAKKQAEIEAAKKKAQEDARLASIMNSNRVDISQYISQGMANRNSSEQPHPDNGTSQPAEGTPEAHDGNPEYDETLRRAQEIIDRLNREAAEDEAKKQAEIDAAKEYARRNNL